MIYPSKIVRHLIIPDTQQKPGVGTNHLRWIGQYIVDQRPSVIIHLGDHYDLPSLSTYDKGTVRAEGKRLDKDIEAGKASMGILQGPLKAVRKAYKPRKVFLLGNHEHRLKRHVDANPELIGTVRSEEHTSELQSQSNLVCRLLLEKKKKHTKKAVETTITGRADTST